VLVLALAIGGGAAAIVLSQQSKTPVRLVGSSSTIPPASSSQPTQPESSTNEDSTSPDTAESPTDTESPPNTSSTGETPSTPNTPMNGALPDESTVDMQPEIQHMLLEWHEDVVNGDYQSAWNLMSKRKQVQSTHKYGYAGWVKNQESLNPYLDPSGLQVSVMNASHDTGVATVELTGMKWSKPGASCTEWSGITWVKYEEGAWRYDPGYSTSPEREAEWKSRFAELLGGRC
jgi:hypothetical protein